MRSLIWWSASFRKNSLLFKCCRPHLLLLTICLSLLALPFFTFLLRQLGSLLTCDATFTVGEYGIIIKIKSNIFRHFSGPHQMPTWFKMFFKSFMFLSQWPEGPEVLNVDAWWWRSGVNAELTSHYSQSWCNLFTSMKSTKRQTWPAITPDVPLLTALLQLCCGLFCFMPCT